MKKALLNIDYTYDFVATEGKLTCGEPGQVLHDYILNLTQEFVEQGEYVFSQLIYIMKMILIIQKRNYSHPIILLVQRGVYYMAI